MRLAAMAKNTSVSLGTHFDDFIAKQVANGRYGSASEVMRAALRKLENDERKVEALRALILAGNASGTVEYDYEGLMQEIERDLAQ